jgi:predicted membrane protein
VLGLSGISQYVRLFTFLAIWYMAIICIFSAYYNKKHAHAALLILYSLNLLDLVMMISFMAHNFLEFIVISLLSINGILASLHCIYKRSSRYEQSVKELEVISKTIPAGEEKVDGEKVKVEKAFGPGKYVASANGENYHSPKCDWAKKISKKRLLWFLDKATAESQGFKRCGLCVK